MWVDESGLPAAADRPPRPPCHAGWLAPGGRHPERLFRLPTPGGRALPLRTTCGLGSIRAEPGCEHAGGWAQTAGILLASALRRRASWRCWSQAGAGGSSMRPSSSPSSSAWWWCRCCTTSSSPPSARNRRRNRPSRKDATAAGGSARAGSARWRRPTWDPQPRPAHGSDAASRSGDRNRFGAGPAAGPQVGGAAGRNAGRAGDRTCDESDTADRDGDGVNNYEECWRGLGTEEWDEPDTDNDGLLDGVEIYQLGTFVSEPDTDGDYITDTLEVQGYQYRGQTWYLNPLATRHRRGQPARQRRVHDAHDAEQDQCGHGDERVRHGSGRDAQPVRPGQRQRRRGGCGRPRPLRPGPTERAFTSPATTPANLQPYQPR